MKIDAKLSIRGDIDAPEIVLRRRGAGWVVRIDKKGDDEGRYTLKPDVEERPG